MAVTATSGRLMLPPAREATPMAAAHRTNPRAMMIAQAKPTPALSWASVMVARTTKTPVSTITGA